jgi:hypothetical protein
MTNTRGCVCTLNCEHHRDLPGCPLPPRDNGWCDKCAPARFQRDAAKAMGNED